ncbi:FHA domain-containing protein [Larkinella punicea]|uniref:FHA domain-containing protein n=1 Tax=Larkinella punicea TaxID=2315727 RepID=A0A368JX05_9BACT|nr:FHA domain-containing protein [Larkinella punicea]RCR71476.1 FHA domain-containing protein [Larkinella punicea]
MTPDGSRRSALRVIRIGKNKDNDVVLEKPGISRYHARLTLYTDFLGLLEDLDSTYGTEVDGRRIVQKMITPGSAVVLGTIVRLDVKTLFDQVSPRVLPPPVPPLPNLGPGSQPGLTGGKPPVFAEEFKRLSWHFEQYTGAKQEILTGDPKKKAWVRVAVGWVPFAGFPLASLIDAYVFNTSERVQVLDEAFRRDYKCPNPACQQFLGYVPYAELLRQRQCRFCKCLWVDS